MAQNLRDPEYDLSDRLKMRTVEEELLAAAHQESEDRERAESIASPPR